MKLSRAKLERDISWHLREKFGPIVPVAESALRRNGAKNATIYMYLIPIEQEGVAPHMSPELASKFAIYVYLHCPAIIENFAIRRTRGGRLLISAAIDPS